MERRGLWKHLWQEINEDIYPRKTIHSQPHKTAYQKELNA